MNTTFKTASLVLGAMLAIGCVVDDDGTGGDGGTADTTVSTTMTTSTSATTMTTAMTDSADTGMTDTADTSATGTATAGSESSSTSVDPNEFQFLPNPPEDYTQVDRKGMPGVNTALNLNVPTLPMDHKDAYNAANPVDDANGTFFPNIEDSLDTLHLGSPNMGDQVADNTGLDDDLTNFMPSLTPCTPPQLAADDCIIQGGPLIIPDVLAIDTTATATFPNGRLLTDPVIDVTLAVLLLDLDVHTADTFATVMVSQSANDGVTTDTFPYLAPAF